MSLSTDPAQDEAPDERLAVNVDVGLTSVVLKIYEQIVAQLRVGVKPALNDRLAPGDSKRPFVVTAAGVRVPIGRVTRSAPTPGVRIVDEAAYIEWVEATYPDEIVVTKTVRPAFEKRFKTSRLGDYVVGPNGEADPPGLGVGQREPAVSTSGDLAAVRELWEAGETEAIEQIQAVMQDAVASLFRPEVGA